MDDPDSFKPDNRLEVRKPINGGKSETAAVRVADPASIDGENFFDSNVLEGFGI